MAKTVGRASSGPKNVAGSDPRNREGFGRAKRGENGVAPAPAPGHSTVFATSNLAVGVIRSYCNSNELGSTVGEAGEERTLEPRFREMVPDSGTE